MTADPSEAARALVALRRRGPLACALCGREFEARLNVGDPEKPRYCSNACKCRAYQRRKKAKSTPA